MRLPLLVGAAFGVANLVAASSAAAAPASTPVPGLSAAGDSIARAADGSMWVTEPASPGRVARVAPNGAVTEYTGGVTANFSASRSPDDIAVTSDGYVWFLLHGGSDEIGLISQSTGAVSRYLLTSGTPTSIAAGPDGKLWMTADGDHGGTDFVARYDRAAGTTQPYSAGLSANSEPSSLTPAGEGLAFVETGGSGRLGQITTGGTLSLQSIGGAASALAVGPSGALWFVRGAGIGLIGAVNNALFPVQTTPTALAAGPDGAMWATTTGGIVRTETDGTTTTFTAGLDSSAKGIGLAAGADGRMWMTLDRAPFLVRITVPPLVGTPAASSPSPSTATVTTDVRPNGIATTASLQLRGAGGGTWSTLSTTAVGDGVDSVPVRFDLASLAAGTHQALRVIATNAAGIVTSATTELDIAAQPAAPAVTTPQATTPAASNEAASPDPSAAAPVAEPAPVLGSTVVLRPVRGTVLYRVPGSTTAQPIDGAASIPTGSIIDTTHGAVELSSRVDGANQTGTFHGGEFRVKQVVRSGMTRLYLTAPLECGAPGATGSRLAAKKPRKSRRVWGEDKGGKFETHGNDSVATVRGTRWLTTDTCKGTSVRVFAGKVSVKPTAGGRAVLVKSGQRHFTPHPR